MRKSATMALITEFSRWRCTVTSRRAGIGYRSDAAIPGITLVFPIAALAAANAVQRLHQHDALEIFGLLKAKLAFGAQADRRAMRHIQRLAVQPVRQERLRMHRFAELTAIVII